MRFSFRTGVTWRALATVRWNTGPFVRTDNFLALEDKIQPLNLGPLSTPITSNPAIVARVSVATTASLADNVTVQLPANIQVGDMLFFMVSMSGSVASELVLHPGAIPTTQVAGAAASVTAFYYIYNGEPVTSAKFRFTDGFTLAILGIELFVVRGADNSVAPQASNGVTGSTSTPDPGSVTPTFAGGNRNLWISGVRQSGLISGGPWTGFPAGWADTGSTVGDSAGTIFNSTAFATFRSSNSSEDPGAYTSPSTTTAVWSTFAIRGGSPASADLQVRLNYRVVQPSLLANAQSFPGHTVNTGLKAFPAAFTNAQAFNTQAVARTIKPAALVNAQVFQTPLLRRAVKPSVLANSQVFQAPTVKVTLKPTALANSQVFQTPKVNRTVKPATFTDGDTFFAPAVITGATKAPAVFTNASTFNSPKIQVRLFPATFTNAQAFGAPTVSLNRIVSPTTYANAQVFQVPKVNRTMKPAALVNAQVFQSPRLVMFIKPGAFTNTSTLRAVTVQAPTRLTPAAFVNSQAFGSPIVTGGVSPNFRSSSGLFATGYLKYKIPKVKPQDKPKGFVLPPPAGFPKGAEIMRTRAYPLKRGPLKGKTILVNEPPTQEAQPDALDLILAALLLGTPEGPA